MMYKYMWVDHVILVLVYLVLARTSLVLELHTPSTIGGQLMRPVATATWVGIRDHKNSIFLRSLAG